MNKEVLNTVINMTLLVVGVVLAVFLIAAIVPGYLYSKIPAGAAIKNYRENKKIWK